MAPDPPAVDLLGQVSVRHSGHALSGGALGGRRIRVALVMLGLSSQPVSADRLAAALWPAGPPPTWRAALRGVIGALRGALAPLGLDGQRLIVTTSVGYTLAAGARTDVGDVTERVVAAEALAREGRYGQAADTVEPATRVRGDDLLPGEDDPWLVARRRALEELRLRALALLADAASRSGQHSRALAAARQAAAEAPLDENAHRALIAALGRAGDRAGAVAAYEQCRAQLAEHLGIDPSPETAREYLAALRDHAAAQPAGRVPAERTRFIPRPPERRLLAEALAGPGLVTVTGKGGVGKTRLAQHTVRRSPDFPGAAFWTALSAVADDGLVASAVAAALGARVGAGDPSAAVSDRLAPLGRALLVLDGCELVVDGAASLAGLLLGACPQLTILATSRRPLSLPDERVVRVGPFPPPAATGPADLAAHPSVQLLQDRVRARGGELRLDRDTAPLVAELCARCGGLPLALELAAAQLASMPIGDLLDHLDDTSPDQLRSVLRRSHALLSPDEAAVFRRLAVLDGPVGLPLIKQVVCGADVPELRVVRLLRELTAQGLLAADTTGPRWRYRQDDDVHRYAHELLDAAGETGPTLDRLAQAVCSLLPPDARAAPESYAAQITDALGPVRSLLGACLNGRARRDQGLEVAFRLHRYWASTNVAEGRFWLTRLLAGQPESPWACYAMFAAGYLSYWSGDAEAGLRELGHAAELLRGRDGAYRARALIYLAGLADDQDRGGDAVSYVREAIGAAEPFGADLRVGAAMGMGCVLAERADPRAASYAAEAIALCRAAGSPEQLAATLPTAAMVCWQAGDLDRARAWIAEARPLLAGTRRIARAVLLSAAAGVALADGRIGDAVEDARAADNEATALGVERELPLARALLAQALLAAGDLTGAAGRAAAAVRAAGRLSYDFPLAVCLESAALVALRAGPGEAGHVARMLAYSADLRERGERPVPPALRPAVDLAHAALGDDIARLRGAVARDDALAAAAAALNGLLCGPSRVIQTG